jgi:hypothetical protein
MNSIIRAECRTKILSDDIWKPHIEAARPAQPGEAGAISYARNNPLLLPT